MPIADDSDSSSDYRLGPRLVAKGAVLGPVGPHDEIDDGDPLDPRGGLRAADDERVAQAAKAKAGAGEGLGAKSSSSGFWAKAPPPKPPAPKAAPPLPPPSPQSSSSDSGDTRMIPAKSVGAVAIAPPVPPPPPKAKAAAAGAIDAGAKDAIGGGKALYKEYRDPHTAKLYCNWRFYCPYKGTPGHPPGCMRTVGVIPKNTRLGQLEPIAFLHVWRDTPPNIAKYGSHRKTPPPPAKVKAFLETHYAELQELFHQFSTP